MAHTNCHPTRAVQAPQVQLVNGTTLALGRPNSRLQLNCRALGNPSPWVEWFRNGKLLRNRPGRFQIRTGRSVGPRGAQARLSQLELELRPGRNESGIYECQIGRAHV